MNARQNSGGAVSNKAGFSLIEVVLTLVILGLLMGLVTSNLRTASLRNGIKADRGQLALIVEDLRTMSLYANRDLSLRAYLMQDSSDTEINDFYHNLQNLTVESYERRMALAARLDIKVDLEVRSPGACSAAEGDYILSSGDVLSFSIEPMTCHVLLG